LAVLLACVGAAAHADAGWFEPGDSQLRLDLQLLNDAKSSLSAQPVAYPACRVAIRIGDANEQQANNAAVKLALDQVRLRLKPAAGRDSIRRARRRPPGA
jgi:hypothetical protein